MSRKPLNAIALALSLALSGCSGILHKQPILSPEPSPLTRVAFGSCTNEDLPQPLWNELSAAKPQLFLYLGDNVYADKTEDKRFKIATEESFQDSYQRLANNPGYAAFSKQVPIMASWDDHDTGMGDAGRENPVLIIAKKFWMEFFNTPQDSPIRQREGIYDARIFGPEGQRVQIIMLDTRTFRSPLLERSPENIQKYQRYQPSNAPNQDMLGAQQWLWFEQQLMKPAEVRIIASSIQVLAENHGYERWGNLPSEQQHLFNLLKSTAAKTVVFVSGDRHMGGIYKKQNVTAYPLVEVTSSSLNSPIGSPDPEQDLYQLGELVIQPNFGLIDIDWKLKQLTFKLNTSEKDTVRSIQVSF